MRTDDIRSKILAILLDGVSANVASTKAPTFGSAASFNTRKTWIAWARELHLLRKRTAETCCIKVNQMRPQTLEDEGSSVG